MPTIIPIADPEDPRVSVYRDIREKDLVGRRGNFIAEGEVVLRTLITAKHYHAQSVLLAEKRLGGLLPLLFDLPDDVPIYVGGQAVLDTIIGFSMHRGVLALGRQEVLPAAETLLARAGQQSIVMMLLGIANHDNMGGLFRNAAAFGIDAVILDSTCCDPLYRKSIRVSVGAALTVPFARLPPGADPLALLSEAGFTTLALSPHGDRTLNEQERPNRVAVLFGTEGPGLPQGILAKTNTVRIPMHETFDSLNVATSSGIVLHHLAFAAIRSVCRSSPG